MENAHLITRLNSMTAEGLLKIPADEPERLFTADAKAMKAEYHHLLKKWHPDRTQAPQARDVMERLVKLYECGKEKLTADNWQVPGEIRFLKDDGSKSKLRYVKKTAFEYGDCYISRTLVTYVIRPEFRAEYDHAVRMIKGVSYPDDRMRKEFERGLPQIDKAFTAQNGHVLIIKKDPEYVRVRDVLDYCGGKLDPKHVVWVMSCLYNLCCYFQVTGLTHNDISLDSLYIGPKAHVAALLGGWWFAQRKGDTLTALPDRTYNYAPPDVLRSGNADPRVDLTLLRVVGRELLADPRGVHLHKDPSIPRPLASWLRMPSCGNAIQGYGVWQTSTLQACFGPRRYTEMNITFDDVYGQKGGAPKPHP